MTNNYLCRPESTNLRSHHANPNENTGESHHTGEAEPRRRAIEKGRRIVAGEKPSDVIPCAEPQPPDAYQPATFLSTARMFFRYAPHMVVSKEMPEPFASVLLAEDNYLWEDPSKTGSGGFINAGMAAPEGYREACEALLKLMKEAPDSWLAVFVLDALSAFLDNPGILDGTAMFTENLIREVNRYHAEIRTAFKIFDRHPELFRDTREEYADFINPTELVV
jgi:hypothetical protein